MWDATAWPIGATLAGVGWLVRASSDVRVEGPGAGYHGPAVYANWHRHIPFLMGHHGAHHRWMIVGAAPYLAPMARWCALSGLRVVRIDRATADATLATLVLSIGRGDSVTLAVDGPAGPAFRVKRGCVELARAARVPIIPVGYRCQRGATVARRWDRLLVPSVADRIVVRYGAPLWIDDTRQVAEWCELVGAALDDLER